MDVHQPDDHVPDDPLDLSRREVLLRVGTGGMAVALLARSLSAAQAQEATPAAEGGRPARVLISKDGTVRDVGDETVTVQPGESFYIPANVPDGARNDGTELHVSLGVDLIPAEGMATPTS
jgi:hypothetical protein